MRSFMSLAVLVGSLNIASAGNAQDDADRWVPDARQVRALRIDRRNERLEVRRGAITARAVDVSSARRARLASGQGLTKAQIVALRSQPRAFTYGSVRYSDYYGGYHGYRWDRLAGHRVYMSPAVVYVPVPWYVSSGVTLSLSGY
jgi:hypothetical protein